MRSPHHNIEQPLLATARESPHRAVKTECSQKILNYQVINGWVRKGYISLLDFSVKLKKIVFSVKTCMQAKSLQSCSTLQPHQL